MSRAVARGLIARIDGAMTASTFDARDDRQLAWFAMRLDERGWKEAGAVLADAFVSISQIQDEAEARLEASAEEGLTATASILLLRIPEAGGTGRLDHRFRDGAGSAAYVGGRGGGPERLGPLRPRRAPRVAPCRGIDRLEAERLWDRPPPSPYVGRPAEAEADRAEADRRVAVDGAGAAEVEVALGPDGAAELAAGGERDQRRLGVVAVALLQRRLHLFQLLAGPPSAPNQTGRGKRSFADQSHARAPSCRAARAGKGPSLD